MPAFERSAAAVAPVKMLADGRARKRSSRTEDEKVIARRALGRVRRRVK
jgi:hypothetical protein